MDERNGEQPANNKVCDHDEPCACYVEGYTQGKEPVSEGNKWTCRRRTPRLIDWP